MPRGPFDPTFDDLPETLPVFPLSGALLLPGGLLPLNIFEPRYLAMTDAALASHRLIGMIQPRQPEDAAPRPALYPVGCAGRITSFKETDDGRYLIALSGICRFAVVEELAEVDGYRRVVPDFAPFRDDMSAPPETPAERARLMAVLDEYFALNGISTNPEALAAMDDGRLATTVAMVCPLDPREKQALLEAADAAERTRLLTGMVEMATAAERGAGAAH